VHQFGLLVVANRQISIVGDPAAVDTIARINVLVFLGVLKYMLYVIVSHLSY
jgi:hypothetical protein